MIKGITTEEEFAEALKRLNEDDGHKKICAMFVAAIGDRLDVNITAIDEENYLRAMAEASHLLYNHVAELLTKMGFEL